MAEFVLGLFILGILIYVVVAVIAATVRSLWPSRWPSWDGDLAIRNRLANGLVDLDTKRAPEEAARLRLLLGRRGTSREAEEAMKELLRAIDTSREADQRRWKIEAEKWKAGSERPGHQNWENSETQGGSQYWPHAKYEEWAYGEWKAAERDEAERRQEAKGVWERVEPAGAKTERGQASETYYRDQQERSRKTQRGQYERGYGRPTGDERHTSEARDYDAQKRREEAQGDSGESGRARQKMDEQWASEARERDERQKRDEAETRRRNKGSEKERQESDRARRNRDERKAVAEPRTKGQASADPKGYYGLLGVQRTATYLEIRKAYRKRIQEYHPDLFEHDDHQWVRDQAREMTARVNEAWEVLGDPQKRARYDHP